MLEHLENRCLLATFAGAGPVLTITLDRTGEAIRVVSSGTGYTVASNFAATQSRVDPTGGAVAGFGTNIARINASTYATIQIQSTAASTSVTFADSGSNAYTADLVVSLNHDRGVSFTGASNFSSASLTVTADGPITSAPGSSLKLPGAGTSLSLTTVGDAMSLGGSIACGGTVTLASLGGPLALGSLQSAALVAHVAGFITQTAPLAAVSASFTVIGNYGITLPNSGNAIGTVSLNNPGADGTAPSAIQFVNGGAVTLANSQTGLGSVSVTSIRGNILEQTGAIVQPIGAGSVSFTAGGTLIDLGAANDLSGPVVFRGDNVATISFHNIDTQATAPTQASLPKSLKSLTIDFDNAPATLSSLTLTNLSVTAEGIGEVSNNMLRINGTATFDSGSFTLSLGDSGDQKHLNVIHLLELHTTGEAGVNVFTRGNLMLGNLDLGPGGLSLVTIGGKITQMPGTSISHKNSLTSVIYGQEGVNLSSPDNVIPGVLGFVPPSGNFPHEIVGDVNVNSACDLHLVSVIMTGNLSVRSAKGPVSASSLQVRGNTTITSGTTANPNAIELNKSNNNFGGTLTLNGSDVAVTTATGVTLGPSIVGSLSIMANLSTPAPGFSQGSIAQESGTSSDIGNATLDAGRFGVSLAVHSGPQSKNGTTVALSAGATSTVSADVPVTLGAVKQSGGSLTISALGPITQSGGAIDQSGAGTVTLIARGSENSVTLDASGNTFSNPVNVQGGDVTLDVAIGQTLKFATGTRITGALIIAGAGDFAVDVPLSVESVIVSAGSALIGSNITTTGGGMDFKTPVTFAGPSSGITLETADNADVTFESGVQTDCALTFAAGTGTVELTAGTWNQGANALTVIGSLEIGSQALAIVPVALPVLVLASGPNAITLNGTGSDSLTVQGDGTLEVTGGKVILANGNVPVTFVAGSRLGIAFAANAELDVTGAGGVSIAGASLFGSGSANAASTTILAAPNSTITGTFAGSENNGGKPIPFLAESDVVMLGYTSTAVVAVESGTLALNGTAQGTLPNGDQYTVTSSLGASAELVVLPVGNRIDVVVRNNSGPPGSTPTLTISSPNAATFLDVGGIVVDGSSDVIIQAANVNLDGDLIVNDDSGERGSLAGLTFNDAQATSTFFPIVIASDGTAIHATSITAADLKGVVIETTGPLSLTATSLEPAAAGPASRVVAPSFGAIQITDDFDAQLTSTSGAIGSIGTVTVGGTLANSWTVAGAVNSVSAGAANGWTLNDPNGAIGQISVTNSATNTTIVAQSIQTLAAGGWNGGRLDFDNTRGAGGSTNTAPAIASLSIGAAGLTDATIIGVSGSNQAVALGNMTVAGDVSGSTLTFSGGPVGTVTIYRNWNGSSLTADTVAELTIKGSVDSTGKKSDSGSFAVIGPGASIATTVLGTFHVEGQFTESSLALSNGAAGSILLDGLVSGGTINAQVGNIAQVSMPSGVANSSIDAGNLIALIASGPWTNSNLLCQLVGSMRIDGDLSGGSRINAAANIGGPKAPLGVDSFVVTGNIDDTSLTFRNGIGAFTVGNNGTGTITNSSITVDNVDADVPGVGQIALLNAGSMVGTTIDANTLGTVNIQGDVSDSNIFAGGRGGAGSSTLFDVEQFHVTGDWKKTPLLTGIGQVGSLEIDGVVTTSQFTFGGSLNSFVAGEWLGSQLSGQTITTFQVRGDAFRGLPGNFANDTGTASVLSIASPSGSITTFEVDGNLVGSLIDVAPSVRNFVVKGMVRDDGVMAIATAPGSSIGTVSVGGWQNTGLSTNAVGTWKVAGGMSGSLINIVGNAGGRSSLALGSFTAGGTVAQSTFQVAAGNVGSFTSARFIQSSLLAGYRLPRPFDLNAFPSSPALYWTANLSINAFQTTGPGASFVRSNVAAAKLGAVRLSGVAPVVPSPTTSYGVLFRRSAGPGGPIELGQRTVLPGYRAGAFVYSGQRGIVTSLAIPTAAGVSGEPVAVLATISGPAGPPSGGSVRFVLRNADNVVVFARSVPLGPGGSATLITGALPSGTYQVAVSYSGAGGFLPSAGTGTLVVAAAPSGSLRVVGSRPGEPGVVRVFDSRTGMLVSQFQPYGPNFHGGVRVAVGDVNGDGAADVVTAPGRGPSETVKVFDASGMLETRFMPYPANYRGGVRVAVGDVTGSRVSEILIQRPGVRTILVYNGQTGQQGPERFYGVLQPKYSAGPG